MQRIERRYHERVRTVAIVVTVASIGIFSPVTVPIIVRESVKIAELDRKENKTNSNSI